AVMKLGNAVSLLEPFSWVPQDRVFYWGDLDTHGLAILARARQVFPQLRSVLMDEVTLRAWPQFWTQEKSQASLQALPELTVEERAVYDGLHQNR
ncbi:Wadjet anti-phage system protein JetD domain-containing protein, partial [Chromohalobacter sp. HP20-39]